MSALYVYALLGEPPAGALGRGLAGEPLQVVGQGSFLAVAGTVARAPAVDAASLRAHDRTLRRLAGLVDAVLPVRFCTLVEDEAALAALLAPQTAELREALALVAGREQMTLRLSGPALTASPAAAGPEAEPTGPGARYLAERLRERRRVHSAREIEALRHALGALVVAERIERLDTPPLLASVYHLIERGRCARYLTALDAAQAGLAPVIARPSGPWPPYAFAPGAVR